jgi:hypothetical protein
MANPSDEAASIDAAYDDQLKLLFKTLCTALADEHDDKVAVSRFTAGFNIAQHARQLALGVVAPSSGKTMPLAKTASASRKRK